MVLDELGSVFKLKSPGPSADQSITHLVSVASRRNWFVSSFTVERPTGPLHCMSHDTLAGCEGPFMMPFTTKPWSRQVRSVALYVAVPAAASAATVSLGTATVQKSPLLAMPGL